MKKIFAGLALVVAVMVLVIGVPAIQATQDTPTMAYGTITGTGSAINVTLGWKPNSVLVTNITPTNAVSIKWTNGMGTKTGIKTAATNTTFALTSFVTNTYGISQYSGSTSAAPGFTIGTDADLNVTGQTMVYEAYR
jgi:hypothetical protein